MSKFELLNFVLTIQPVLAENWHYFLYGWLGFGGLLVGYCALIEDDYEVQMWILGVIAFWILMIFWPVVVVQTIRRRLYFRRLKMQAEVEKIAKAPPL